MSVRPPADPGCGLCVSSVRGWSRGCVRMLGDRRDSGWSDDHYRRRAGEYDVTAYGEDVAVARAHIAGLVAKMRPAGACWRLRAGLACGLRRWRGGLTR